MIPLIVVEGPIEQFDHAVQDVLEAGWQLVPGWSGTGRGAWAPTGADPVQPGTVQVGVVRSEADAAGAVGAAVAGCGLVVHALAPREVLDALCDDLRHLGRLDHRIGDARVVLTRDERDLLARLAAGASVADAARALFLSRRSVERRLVALRARFGVATPVELLTAYTAQTASVDPAPHA